MHGATFLLHVAMALVATGLLLAVALMDWRTQRISNWLTGALLAWAMLQAFWLKRPDLPALAAGALIGGGLFWLLRRLGRGALGLGDVKLALAGGALLGWPAVLPGLLSGMLIGGGAAALLLFSRRARRQDRFAYGPYLALGIWLVYAAGLIKLL